MLRTKSSRLDTNINWDGILKLKTESEGLLGERGWRLLCRYGRVMSGPHVGRYVSGLPYELQRDLVRRLVAGETVSIHLMHMHRSGDYKSSCLRLRERSLMMVFNDREVLA